MTHLIQDQGGGCLPGKSNEILEFVALDDLTGRVARVGGEDDLETLVLDIFL